MSWPTWNQQQWPLAQATNPLTAPVNTALPVTNSISVNPSQYTSEQWATLQQQNWQQWMQWQQQYQQWQQQYGDQYQKSFNAVPQQPSVTAPIIQGVNPVVTQPVLTTPTQQLQHLPYQQNTVAVPPPLPPESKPPPPPETPVQNPINQPYQQYTQPPPNFLSQTSNFNNKPAQNPTPTKPTNVQPPPVNRGQFDSKPENKTPTSQPPSLLSLKFEKPPFINRNDNKRKYPDDNAQFKDEPVPEKQFRPNNPRWTSLEKIESVPQTKPNNVDLSEAEKNFDEQFKSWEEQFNKWKEQNANHPDKQQYKEYEAKWETWRNQLIEKREQMRRKRLGLPITKPITNPVVPPTLMKIDTPNVNVPSVPNVNDTKPESPKLEENVIKPTYTEPPKEQRPKRNSMSKSEVEQPVTSYEFMSNKEKGAIPGLDLVEILTKSGHPESTETKKPETDLDALSRGLNSILGDEKLMDMISKVSQQSMLNYGKGGQNTTNFSMPQPKETNQWPSSNTFKNTPAPSFERNDLPSSDQRNSNSNQNFNRPQNQQNFNENRDSVGMNQNQEQFNYQEHNAYNNFPNKNDFGAQRDNFSGNQNFNRNQNNSLNNQTYRRFNNENNFNSSGPNHMGPETGQMRGSFDGNPNMYPMSHNDNNPNNNFQGGRGNHNQESFGPNRNMMGNVRNDFSMQDRSNNRFSHNTNFNPHPQNKPPALLDLAITKPPEENLPQMNVANGSSPNQVNEFEVDAGFILTPATVVDYEHKSLDRQDDQIIFVEPVRTFDYGHKPMHQFNSDEYRRHPNLLYNPSSLNKDIRRRHDFSREELDENRMPALLSNMRRREYHEKNNSDKDFQHYYNRTLNQERRDKSFSNDRSYNDKPTQSSFPMHEEKKNIFPINENSSSNSYQFRKKETESFTENENSINESRVSNVRSNKSNTNNVILIEDILNMPGRAVRPPRIVIILRGPPGSGKTYLAKLIKDKEASQGGSARILSLEDYFMVEVENETIDKETGRKIKMKEMVYEYEECMEKAYLSSLTKAFKKTINDGYFSFIIVDCVNNKINQYEDMWSFAKQNGFQVYVCQMELDVGLCSKKNIHGRTEDEIAAMVDNWEQTPSHHILLDATNLLQAASISEVEMDEVSDDDNLPDFKEEDEDLSNESDGFKSKWEIMEHTFDKLARLDGTNKPLRPSTQSMEDYLQLDDSIIQKEVKPGQKKVRWADLVEQQEQEKMRAIGFVVGQTDWNRMMDPSQGSNALTQTKFIESVRKW